MSGGTHISPVTRLLTPIELGSLMTEPQSERPFPIIGVSLDNKGVVIPVSISKSKIAVYISTTIWAIIWFVCWNELLKLIAIDEITEKKIKHAGSKIIDWYLTASEKEEEEIKWFYNLRR